MRSNRALAKVPPQPLEMTIEETIEFENDDAKIAWEVGRAISAMSAELPAESQLLDAKPISFDPEDAARGTYAIFLAGTVIGTRQRGVFVVPERSLMILEKLGIAYNIQ